ncbi:NADH-quinone oxidoreductase subunit J [Agilicoccus flavus]|uniref:NADH-quinone oxidoreductase subunit J n=1 Tax=Agilicoccus flavus TaxID=2775968 RepID=UPI001CF67617|nr:NADH-quinone oxidoreductase subunit J [Agilicoccus flavus]
MTGTAEAVLFWIAGPTMVLGALGLVFAKRAVYAALSMALVMILLGIVYLTQGADFLGVIQIFVYTGAVMMLFLFVIMLVGVDASDTTIDSLRAHKWFALVIAVGLGLLLASSLSRAVFAPPPPISQMNADGNVAGLASLIFGEYVWVFELTSALLITAALAAMVLAHRERLTPKPTQREWSRRRVHENRNVAGLPAPGVYARHNAVDTPALLPDGTPSELSVSRVLAARHQLSTPERYSSATPGEAEPSAVGSPDDDARPDRGTDPGTHVGTDDARGRGPARGNEGDDAR